MSRWSLLVVFLMGAPALAASYELKNDGLIAGGMVNFQGGFATGEMGAVRLTAPTAGLRLDQVQFMFGGAATTQTVTLFVWNDTAATLDPGMQLFTGDYQVTGADSAFQSLDLSADGVVLPQTFRVGIQFQHAGLPSIARDDDGTLNAALNFIHLLQPQPTWFQSSTLGLTGDFIIRAFVSDLLPDGGTPDGGAADGGAGQDGGANADAGTPADAGTQADAGTIPPDAGTGGAKCVANAECSAGLYCDSATGRCTFDCRVDADCGADAACNTLGRCITRSAGGCGCASVEVFPLGLLALALLRRRRAHGKQRAVP